MCIPVKKIARISAWTLGGILGIFLLAIAGALLWLRTDTGERTVASIAREALAEQGLYLNTDVFEGPLPTRLHLKNIRIADAKGDWFAAQDVLLELKLSDLLRKTATVSLLQVQAPEVFRLPQLPTAPDETPAAPTAPSEPGFFKLPIAVRLSELLIENAKIHAPLAFPEAPVDAEGDPLITATIRGTAEAEAYAPLKATVGVTVNAANTATFAELLNTGELPVNAAELVANIAAEVGETISASATGAFSATQNTTPPYTMTYGFGAHVTESAAAVSDLFIDGLGVRIDAQAKYGLADNAAQADVSIAARNGAQWSALLADATGHNIDGTVQAKATASLAADGGIAANLTLNGSQMRWGMEEMQHLLGAEFAIALNASGGAGSPYAADLSRLEAGGVSASGKASFSPDEKTLNAKLAASLADIAALAPETSGALHAKASVTGTLDAPVFSLETTSYEIRTHAGLFREIKAAFDGGARLADSGAASVQSRVTLTLGDSPAGPAAFKTSIDASQDVHGNLSARIHEMDLALAGTEFAADITTTIPAEKNASPSVTGHTKAAVVDWKPIAALAGIPLAGGKTLLEVHFAHSGDGQKVNASWRIDKLAMPEAFAINGLSGTLDAANIMDAPDLVLDAAFGKGEVGPLEWRSGAAKANVKQGKGAFAATLRTDDAAQTALRTLSANPTAGKPERRERASVSGAFSLDPMQIDLNRLALRLPDSPLGVFLTAPTSISLGDTIHVADLKLNVFPGKGSVACNARLKGANGEADATVSAFPLRLARELTGAPIPNGNIDAAIAFKKQGSAITGKADVKAVVLGHAAPGEATNTPPVVFTLVSELDKKPDPNFPDLRINANGARLKGTAFLDVGPTTPTAQRQLAVFNIPLQFSADGVPAPDMAARIGAKAAWQGDAGALWTMAPLPDRELTGTLKLDADLKGTLTKPEYAAALYLANGRFTDNILGLLLTKIAVEAKSASNTESKIVLRAEDVQGGYAALEGRLLPPPQTNARTSAGVIPHIAARGHINHLEPLHRDDLFIRLSGRFAAEGPLDIMKITADMEVERGELSLLTSLGGGVSTLEITDPNARQEVKPAGPTCDITVAVPNRFFIRGRGLDSEWEGKLAVRGPLSGPSLTGSLKPVRGSFDLLSRSFAFDKGDISFFGGDRINPALNLSLTYTGPTITAIVHAQGSAAKPKIVIESRPPLPHDQIMAEVLFGKDFSNLSRFEALQVANSVRQLANIGDSGLDPVASMRTTLGLDMLRVGSSGSSSSASRSVSGAPGASAIGGESASAADEGAATPTVEAGKYINDAIYVGVEQGATADSTGVRVEVELLPNLTLQGKSSTRSSEVGLGWKKDY